MSGDGELTPALRNFLAAPGQDANWPSPGTADLARYEFVVEEKLLGESKPQTAVEGGVRLAQVTLCPVSLDDLSVLASRRPDVQQAQLVLAMFWLTFEELPAKRQYSVIRIMIRLTPSAPILLFSPDRPGDGGQSQLPRALAVKPEMAELLGIGAPSIATAYDHGPDGFGWTYRTTEQMPLLPHREVALVLLQLPQATAELGGQLMAKAQISRSVIGQAIRRPTTPKDLATSFRVPLGQAEVPERPPVKHDLGLIIAQREEFDCARELLKFEEGFPLDGHYVYPFSVPGSAIRGICLPLYDVGPARAGVAATQLLSRYQVRVLALTGVARALDPEYQLGDVVVASSVDEYFQGALARPAAAGDGIDFDSGSSAWRAGRDLVRFANNFRYLPGHQGEFTAWCSRGQERRASIDRPGKLDQAREQPDYFVSAIASGDVESAAKSFTDWLRSHHRNCGAIEMECAGLAEAVYQRGRTEMLIVSGIAGFADEHDPDPEAKSWRRYAALNAVDLLSSMLRSPAFPWNQ